MFGARGNTKGNTDLSKGNNNESSMNVSAFILLFLLVYCYELNLKKTDGNIFAASSQMQ